MAFGRDERTRPEPEEVAKGACRGPILLVDVREPNETDVERYPDAVYMPMSSSIRPLFPIPKASRWCSRAARATVR